MFTLTIETENEAFVEAGKEIEAARILRRVADLIEIACKTSGACMDANGNKVGTFELTD